MGTFRTARRGKYNAKAVEIDGIKFHSKGEAAWWQTLKLRERAGEITHLERQPRFPLILPNGVPIVTRSEGFPNGRKAVYTADAQWRDAHTGERTVAEFKGFDDTASRLRRAVCEAIYGLRIEVVRR